MNFVSLCFFLNVDNYITDFGPVNDILASLSTVVTVTASQKAAGSTYSIHAMQHFCFFLVVFALPMWFLATPRASLMHHGHLLLCVFLMLLMNLLTCLVSCRFGALRAALSIGGVVGIVMFILCCLQIQSCWYNWGWHLPTGLESRD